MNTQEVIRSLQAEIRMLEVVIDNPKLLYACIGVDDLDDAGKKAAIESRQEILEVYKKALKALKICQQKGIDLTEGEDE